MGEGGLHKLLATFAGVPLVRKSVSSALASDCENVFVVTGHQHEDVVKAIGDLSCEVVRNDDYASGIAGSLRLGVAAATRAGPDGIMIALADMPMLSTPDFDALIAAFRDCGGRSVVRATGRRAPGNPVIFPRVLHGELQDLTGDVGARSLINKGYVPVLDVDIGDAALVDVDTVEQVLAAGGVLPSGDT